MSSDFPFSCFFYRVFGLAFSVGVGLSLEQVFRGQAKQAACMIYYSRKDAGTPKISPKAGNMVRWSGPARGQLQRLLFFCLSCVDTNSMLCDGVSIRRAAFGGSCAIVVATYILCIYPCR